MKFLVIFLISTSVWSKPLYELGLAMGGGFIPDYPGADQGRNRLIATPSFIYRGQIFKSDRRGTRALFLTSEKWDIDFSFGAALPIESEKNDARNGMDDLDWVFEIGPRATYFFSRTEDRVLSLEFPLRTATSTDFSFTRQRGFRFIPQLDFRQTLSSSWRFGISFKLNYASEELNDYYYEVEKYDVNSNREKFNAAGGHVSQVVSTALVYRRPRFIGILGVRYSEYNNSINRESPLLKAQNNTAIFAAFNYFFYQSKTQGRLDESGEF